MIVLPVGDQSLNIMETPNPKACVAKSNLKSIFNLCSWKRKYLSSFFAKLLFLRGPLISPSVYLSFKIIDFGIKWKRGTSFTELLRSVIYAHQQKVTSSSLNPKQGPT